MVMSLAERAPPSSQEAVQRMREIVQNGEKSQHPPLCYSSTLRSEPALLIILLVCF